MFPVEKLQNLQIGSVYTYSELCRLLSAKEVKGTSRIAQKKVWESYFTLEKVGRRFRLVNIFDSRKFDNVFRKGEEHIANSAKLLLNYFTQYKDEFKQSEKHPELVEKILFSTDIGITCGYLSYDWKSINRTNLLNNPYARAIAEMKLEDDKKVISLFLSEVKEVFSDLLKNMLGSLQREGVIQDCNKVLVRIEDKEYIVLSGTEEEQYHLILEHYIKQCYPYRVKISTYPFTKKDWSQFNKMLKAELGYSVYQCVSIAFHEKIVGTELNEAEQDVLRDENSKLFKERLAARLENKKVRATERVESIVTQSQDLVKDGFDFSAFENNDELMQAQIDQLVNQGVDITPKYDSSYQEYQDFFRCNPETETALKKLINIL